MKSFLNFHTIFLSCFHRFLEDETEPEDLSDILKQWRTTTNNNNNIHEQGKFVALELLQVGRFSRKSVKCVLKKVFKMFDEQ